MIIILMIEFWFDADVRVFVVWISTTGKILDRRMSRQGLDNSDADGKR